MTLNQFVDYNDKTQWSSAFVAAAIAHAWSLYPTYPAALLKHAVHLASPVGPVANDYNGNGILSVKRLLDIIGNESQQSYTDSETPCDGACVNRANLGRLSVVSAILFAVLVT